MIKTIFFLMTMVILASCGSAGNSRHPSADDLYLSWEFMGNHPAEGYSSAVFILENRGKETLGNKDWTIYFNQMGQGVLDESVSGNVRIQHVNGDLLSITPLDGFSLAPGDKVSIAYNKPGRLIKEGEAPAGLYMVFEKDESEEQDIFSLEHYRVLPFPALEKIYPPSSGIPLPDPSWIYKQNATLTDLEPGSISKIIPTPLDVKYSGNTETLSPGLEIHFQEGLDNEAAYLTEMMELLMGVRPSMKQEEASGLNCIGLFLSKDKMSESQSYHLQVAEGEGIQITGADPAGVFYGVQSLLAIMPVEAWKEPDEKLHIDCVSIYDSPAFQYRGIMLDVARNFHKPETIRKMVRIMGFYKLNKLHLSLTNDEAWRLEIPGLPELTELGGFRGHTMDDRDWLIPAYGSGAFPDPERGMGSGYLSRDEFVDLLRFAAKHHVEVIPEINFPGHSRAAIFAMEKRYERLMAEGRSEEAERYRLADPGDRSVYNSAQNFDDNVSCVCKEAPFLFIEKVVDELIAMYRDAGLELSTVHTGGDEVPSSSWTGSPICSAFLASHPEIEDASGLQVYFGGRLLELLSEKGLKMAGWEEISLVKGEKGQWKPNPDFAGKGMVPYVWNSLGNNLDLGNRIANAGFQVVLCNVDNLYFDLAYNHHPAEPGHYWGGFVNTRRSFVFAPYHVFNTTLTDQYRRDIDAGIHIEGLESLKPDSRKNILGLQGQIWSETVKGSGMLEYYYLPKMLGLVERSWAGEADWGSLENRDQRIEAIDRDWNRFANTIGNREMPRLDYLFGGFNYRLPAPGAIVREGKVHANVDFPGLKIHYTSDGSQPDMDSPVYLGPLDAKGKILLRSFDTRGRGSRVTGINAN